MLEEKYRLFFSIQFYLIIGHKHANEGAEEIFLKKNRQLGLFVNFCQFPCSWIRIWIQIPNTDPDLEQPN
jgi:hypothetical protein